MHIRRLTHIFVVTAIAAALSLVTAAAALAQSYPGGGNTPPPTVAGEHFVRGGHLGKTGSDVLLYVIIAILALVAGIALRKVTRTRAAQSGE